MKQFSFTFNFDNQKAKDEVDKIYSFCTENDIEIMDIISENTVGIRTTISGKVKERNNPICEIENLNIDDFLDKLLTLKKK